MWPANLDGSRSRGGGRKLAASRAVRQPSLNEIAQAATALGLSPETSNKAASPKAHWEKHGSVTLKKSGTKQSTLKSIASEIVRTRQREALAVESRRERR